MLGKAPDQNQLDCFNATLKQIINPNHPLVMLADNAALGFNFKLLLRALAFFCLYSLYCTVVKLLGLPPRNLCFVETARMIKGRLISKVMMIYIRF